MLKYLLVLALTYSLPAATVTLRPVADTTLFELNPTHNLGGYTNVAVGGIAKKKAAGGAYAARGLFRFAITNIPSEATISSVTLTLNISRTPGSGGVTSVFDLRRVLKSWGEGDKKDNSLGGEASPLEATWSSRLAPAEAWETPGGSVGSDFSSNVSASLSMDDLGTYTFASSSNLIADVQAWLTNAASNFGWALMSQSENITETARRFASREDAANAPALVVEYSAPVQELRITSLSITNQNVAIAWAGGNPPFQLQQRLSLIGAEWTNAGEPALTNNATLPVTANQSFFRVIGMALAPAVEIGTRSEITVSRPPELAIGPSSFSARVPR